MPTAVDDPQACWIFDTVRDCKGFKDRMTMLPEKIKPVLAQHLKTVNTLHQEDLAKGYGRVYLPLPWLGSIPRPPPSGVSQVGARSGSREKPAAGKTN